MKKHLIYFFLLFLFSQCITKSKTTETETKENKSSVNDKTEEYFTPNYKVIENKIYDEEIKTVRVHKKGWEMSNPAIELKPNEVLLFSFDKLSNNIGDYYYTIVHCNADWKKSELIESQYLDGFFQDYISSYKFSFNSYESYIHYELELPNKNTKIIKSGNYIFKVFKDNDPEKVVLTKRFIVYENLINTKASVNRPSNTSERNYKQEVDFELDMKDMNIPNIFEDIQVVVQQNNRWDNAITNLKPLFVRGNNLIYDYNNGENVFYGGNEHRFLDLRNMRYRGQKVQRILLENKETNVFLIPEEKRRYKNYLYYEDLNGKYIIKNQFAVNNKIESDYVYTHFALKYPQKLENGEIYVFGELSENEFRKEYKMTYNLVTQQYETKVFLKQGYYDYFYMFVNKEGKADVTFIEGDHFETENNYSITTYRKDVTCNCDKIIGYYTFKSNPKL